MIPPECLGMEDWDPEADATERALYDFLNFTRTTGYGCPPTPGQPGTQGSPVPSVMFRFELRCAARLHSRDMSENGYFDHINLEGVGPEDRMRAAGAHFRSAGESIAFNVPPPGQPPSPYDALAFITTMGGSECENLMDSDFDSVGIGVFGDLVTLDFTAPDHL